MKIWFCYVDLPSGRPQETDQLIPQHNGFANHLSNGGLLAASYWYLLILNFYYTGLLCNKIVFIFFKYIYEVFFFCTDFVFVFYALSFLNSLLASHLVQLYY